jgi:hypothetical protein
MIAERLTECLGMMMIGDGVLSALDPHRHAALWRRGPSWWRAMVDPFVRHPEITRWAGVGEVVLGVWLSSRQRPSGSRTERLPS